VRPVVRGVGLTLFLAFSATALPVLVAAGLLLEWQARRALHAEFGLRVESIASAVSAAIPSPSWGMLLAMTPGEEETRTVRSLRQTLQRTAREFDAERIAVWTLDARLVLDTSVMLPIGSPAPRAPLVERELAAVREGRPASTPLFRSESGSRVKIGLAPIRTAEAPAGILLVSAASRTLGAIDSMRRTLVLAGLGGWVLVLLVALALARRLTARIGRLVRAADGIGRGDLESPIPALGGDELGFLAGSLDSMRGALQVREQQLRSMLGGVAHEIRNPLGGVTLFAEMLSRDATLTEDQRQRAQRILDEAIRLDRVVTDFLEYARPERPRRDEVDLRVAIAESAENARAGLTWTGELTIPDETADVRCDPDHLRQVLLNLTRNAMQAAGEEGEVRIRVRRHGGGVEVAVEDSGPGIVAEVRERVFEPFYSGRAEGAGLGLSIVKRLCDLGELDLEVGESELGGALFRLRLPRAE